jgi:hypothetical protein
VVDFWKWAYSDVHSNITRSAIAEFLVAKSLELENQPRREWDPYDLEYRRPGSSPIKIEVKSSSKYQPWGKGQARESKVVFSIRKTREWKHKEGIYEGEPKRHADVYVFCELESSEPLDVGAWRFFVQHERDLPQEQKTISGTRLGEGWCKHEELGDRIRECASRHP